MTGIREIFDFSRAEIFALALLLLLILIGGGILFYQNSTESLPPELFFQTVGVAEGKRIPESAGVPARNSLDTTRDTISPKILLLNLNTAPAESLMMLPRVGKVISQRIVEYRNQIGGFDSVGQLIKVRGIGRKNLEVIRKHLKVEAR